MGKATNPKKKQQEQGKQMSMSYFSNNLLEQLGERAQNTPDFLELKNHEDIPVFVYGTLKEGMRNHHIIQGRPFLGKAKTTQSRFEMKQAQHSGFPVVMDVGVKASFNGRIYGEVFVVKPKDMLTLDRLEDNGGMYIRKLTYVTLLDQQMNLRTGVKNPVIQAWVYVGNPKVWGNRSDVYRCSYVTAAKDKEPENRFEWKESTLVYGMAH